MYAVFEEGSHQYRVMEGNVVEVDYREAAPGTPIEFQRVLLYQNGEDVRIGQPLVEGARILAEVVGETSSKVYVQHFRRRKNYRRLKGHRQPFTEVRIKYILLPGQEPQQQAPQTEGQPAASSTTPAGAGSAPAPSSAPDPGATPAPQPQGQPS